MPYKSRMRVTSISALRPLGTLCLVAMFSLACAPRPAEQPSPSPETTAATAATAGEAGNAGDCAVDADCVPASCCHPNSCVPVAAQPDCAAVSCTADCQPDTMDCGGRCSCEAGSCKAILGKP